MPFDGTTCERLNDALDRLRRVRDRLANGWCQCAYRDGERYCLVGAMLQDELPYLNVVILELLRDALPPGTSPSLTDYNDAAGRTKEEVLCVVDRAILALFDRPIAWWEKNNAV